MSRLVNFECSKYKLRKLSKLLLSMQMFDFGVYCNSQTACDHCRQYVSAEMQQLVYVNNATVNSIIVTCVNVTYWVIYSTHLTCDCIAGSISGTLANVAILTETIICTIQSKFPLVSCSIAHVYDLEMKSKFIIPQDVLQNNFGG